MAEDQISDGLEKATVAFSPSEVQGARTASTAVNLAIGSDVEIARHLSGQLSAKHGWIVFCEGLLWHFDETHWQSFDEPALRRLVHEYDGRQFTSPRGSLSTIKLSKTKIDGVLHELATINEQRDFFAGPSIGINCASGFIVFDEKGAPTLAEHRPEHRARHVLDGSWPKEPSEVVAKASLLAQLLQGCFKYDEDAAEKINLLGEVCGAAALAYATRLIQPKAIVLKGETAENGKSQVLEMLRGVLPSDAVTSVALGKFTDERHLVQLRSKHLNACDELTSAQTIGSDAFKQIVTGDPIAARDLYRSAIIFRAVAQHVFATNDLPTFRGGMDRGVRRRLLVLSFNRAIPKNERVARIGLRIAAEEPDLLLDWAVQGASRLIRLGRFTEPASSKIALDDWLLGADPIAAWFEAEVKIVAEHEMPTKDAYSQFRNWAIDEGFKEATLPAVNTFVQRLTALDKNVQRYRTSSTRMLRGLRVRNQASMWRNLA